MNSIDILNKVQEIQATRGKEYEKQKEGTKERSFNKVATAFNAITGKDITPAEVALMLQVLKDVRQWSTDSLHEDSIVDCVSYASLKGELLYEQYGVTQANIDQPVLFGEYILNLISTEESLAFRVNPESSRRLQEFLFSVGYSWALFGQQVKYTEDPYLSFKDKEIFWCDRYQIENRYSKIVDVI
jgi:hypothetical protein